LNSINNNNKDENSRIRATGFTITYKNELSINLYDKLVDYVRQQDKLNDFLKYDERQVKVYFLKEITDIFQQAFRNACNTYNVDTAVEDFVTDNWAKLRIDELIDLIINYVYNHSPLAGETKTRGIKKQFKNLQQELIKDIIDNWFAIIGQDCLPP
jgi:hypothetical protein